MDHVNMDQDQCVQLIEMYRSFPVLWNAKLKYYHNRNKKEDAWKEISAQIGIPVSSLKAKMKSLMGTFRSERSRENKKTTGSGSDSIYVSKWFAYKYFEFLSDKDTPRGTMTSMKEILNFTCENPQEKELETIAVESTLSNPTDTVSPHLTLSNSHQQQSTKSQRSAKKKRVNEDDDSQLIRESLQLLKSSVDVISDPYNSYGQYIANELRKYDDRTLAMVKMAFSDVMFKADLGILSYPNAQPTYFTTNAAPPLQTYGSTSSDNTSHGSPWTTSTQHSSYYTSPRPSRTPTPSIQPIDVSHMLPSTTGEISQNQIF